MRLMHTGNLFETMIKRPLGPDGIIVVQGMLECKEGELQGDCIRTAGRGNGN